MKPGMAGKMRRMMIFPGYIASTKSGLARRLHAKRTAKAAIELRGSKLERLLNGQDPSALPQDPADLLHLYNTIEGGNVAARSNLAPGSPRCFSPKHCMTGPRTLVAGRQRAWLEHTEKILPDHLRPFVAFVPGPVEMTDDNGVRAWRYTVVLTGNGTSC